MPLSRAFFFVLQNPSGIAVDTAALAAALNAEYVYVVFRWTLSTCVVFLKQEWMQCEVLAALQKHNFRLYKTNDSLPSFVTVVKKSLKQLGDTGLMEISGTIMEHGRRPFDYRIGYLINKHLAFKVLQVNTANDALAKENATLTREAQELKVSLFRVTCKRQILTSNLQAELEKAEEGAARGENMCKMLEFSREANSSLRRRCFFLEAKRAPTQDILDELKQEKADHAQAEERLRNQEDELAMHKKRSWKMDELTRSMEPCTKALVDFVRGTIKANEDAGGAVGPVPCIDMVGINGRAPEEKIRWLLENSTEVRSMFERLLSGDPRQEEQAASQCKRLKRSHAMARALQAGEPLSPASDLFSPSLHMMSTRRRVALPSPLTEGAEGAGDAEGAEGGATCTARRSIF